MLLSAVITLESQQNADIPLQGRAIHAWFLQQVHRHDAELATELHTPNTLRPFAVSDVFARMDAVEQELVLQAGERYFVRITSLQSQLSTLLVEDVLPNLPKTLQLGSVPLLIRNYTLSPSVNRWAGQASFDRLWEIGKSRQLPTLTMQFASPTVFKSRKAFAPIPWPKLVFENLLNRWNAFASLPLPHSLLELVEDQVSISSYQLQAQPFYFGKNKQAAVPAFWGECHYAIRNRNAHFAAVLHTLAAFAFFSGVGKQTTMGMGQCRVVYPKS